MYRERVKRLYDEFTPKDRGFITREEMERVKEILNVDEKTEDVRGIRNAVVRYASDNVKSSNKLTEEEMAIWDKMSAFTAVLDTILYAQGKLY